VKNNIIADKSNAFSIRVTNAFKYLCANGKRIAMFDQFLNSGTAIGALVHEAEFAQSRKDFINKMSIALKEANENKYWIGVLHSGGYFDDAAHNSILEDCKELVAILVSIVNTAKTTTPPE